MLGKDLSCQWTLRAHPGCNHQRGRSWCRSSSARPGSALVARRLMWLQKPLSHLPLATWLVWNHHPEPFPSALGTGFDLHVATDLTRHESR